MNTIGENATEARTRAPSFRLMAAVGVTAALLAVLIAWGGDWGLPPAVHSTGLHPTFRYVNSGWISPDNWQDLGAFSEELRAFVIVSQDEPGLIRGRLRQQGKPRATQRRWAA